MNWSRTLLTLLALMALSVSSVGQESAAPEDEAVPAALPAEAPPPPAETPPPPAETLRLDELFIPSEEIDADEEVIFPVSI
jgi:hypothetical protein